MSRLVTVTMAATLAVVAAGVLATRDPSPLVVRWTAQTDLCQGTPGGDSAACFERDLTEAQLINRGWCYRGDPPHERWSRCR